MSSYLAFEVEVVNKPEDAPNYNRDSPDIRALTITKAIVIKKGTVKGAPTVDIQLQAQDGAEFAAMITGALLEQLAAVIKASR
jgi:hypothetical protein